MAGLELEELRPLLQPGQETLAEDVRQAELQFLAPLRETSGRFMKLEASGVKALAHSDVHAKAQRIAALFHYAPRHILMRLDAERDAGGLGGGGDRAPGVEGGDEKGGGVIASVMWLPIEGADLGQAFIEQELARMAWEAHPRRSGGPARESAPSRGRLPAGEPKSGGKKAWSTK